ncbi:hypothetical protein ACISU4_22445 [Streptomyces wuyuanensis]|uniref:hypothetical protein n=1 Tax=Streptomyces wuyuanensis TaxID=1196353 RepID=UPI00380AB321
MRKRLITTFATAALAVGSVMTLGSGTASAAGAPPNVKFFYNTGSNGVWGFGAYSGNKLIGHGYFHANGDRLSAVDSVPDGYGVAAYLGTSPVREASTYGHNSPYTVNKTGNLPEGKKYSFWICVGGSGGQVCSDVKTVTA